VGMHRRKPTPARNTRSAFTQVSQAVCIGCLGALIHREVKCSATRGHRHRWQSPHRRRAARPRRLLCEPFVSRFEVVAFRGYHSFLLLELLYQRFSLHPPARELGLGSETQAAHLSLKPPNRLQALPQDRLEVPPRARAPRPGRGPPPVDSRGGEERACHLFGHGTVRYRLPPQASFETPSARHSRRWTFVPALLGGGHHQACAAGGRAARGGIRLVLWVWPRQPLVDLPHTSTRVSVRWRVGGRRGVMCLVARNSAVPCLPAADGAVHRLGLLEGFKLGPVNDAIMIGVKVVKVRRRAAPPSTVPAAAQRGARCRRARSRQRG